MCTNLSQTLNKKCIITVRSPIAVSLLLVAGNYLSLLPVDISLEMLKSTV